MARLQTGQVCNRFTTYIAKHCTQVDRSGISFLDWRRSSACTRITWPLKLWCRGHTFPFTGGCSEKAIYPLDRIPSTSFLRSAGSPWSVGISRFVLTVTAVLVKFPWMSHPPGCHQLSPRPTLPAVQGWASCQAHHLHGREAAWW